MDLDGLLLFQCIMLAVHLNAQFSSEILCILGVMWFYSALTFQVLLSLQFWFSMASPNKKKSLEKKMDLV